MAVQMVKHLCFGTIGAISVISGSLLFAAHFTMTPAITTLNIFDANVQPNFPGIMSIVEASMAAATILVGLVSAQALLCEKDTNSKKRYNLYMLSYMKYNL